MVQMGLFSVEGILLLNKVFESFFSLLRSFIFINETFQYTPASLDCLRCLASVSCPQKSPSALL